MTPANSRIRPLILDQLAGGERRVLSLIVAIGKVMRHSAPVKGDLPAMVKSSLRALLDARVIVEIDGLYSLAPTAPTIA